ncbi:MAG: aminotransferase class IV [Candidatus Eisenbacteria bacterium]
MTVLVGRWRMDSDPGEDLSIEWDSAGGINAWVTAHPGAGVYEADRTYPGPRILKFDEHLDRFEASARREGLPLDVDRDRFRSVLRELADRAVATDGGALTEQSVRFLVRAPESRPREIEFVVEPFRPPSPELYEHGVFCATMSGARREHPEAKTSSWMSDRQAYSLPAGAFEGLLVSSEGEILEGATSNFYAVVNGELWTADEGILFGIARQIVLEVAPTVLPVRLEPVRLLGLSGVSEAFLTSSSRAVLPICRIDGTELGSSGEFTRRIADAYRGWVDSHLRPL